ncbi:tetratricopeptide repeat protein [Costertonia aggregata]|uniref:Tetratricopeptide repeat protein n=1 Tax=Costertonia aggregata TaxID=343403 RepID=A0A7H9ASH7_9FLAO|nr:tetratricopeptide repeat protein [Costertonia aggregata]QLG46399.1 tetratricopeptide repeat protein [Costertonia aggregata]
MKHYIILSFLCLFFIQSIQAQELQEKIDSILKIINTTSVDTIKARRYLELSDLTMYNDQKRTLEYIEKANAIYRTSPNKKGIAKLFTQKANYFYRLGKIDSARINLVSSVNTSLKTGDTLRAAIARHNVGILDNYQGNLESASQIMDENIQVFQKYDDSLHLANAYLIKGSIALSSGFNKIGLIESYNGLKIHRRLKDDLRVGEGLFQIGLIHQNTSDHAKAIEILKESILYFNKAASEQLAAQALNYIAFSQIEMENFKEAETNLEESLSISKKLDYTANIARVYQNLGKLEIGRKNYNEAIAFLTRAYDMWVKISVPNNEAEVLLNIGRSHSRKKRFRKSLDFFDRSIERAIYAQNNETLESAYFEKSLALEKLGEYEASLTSFKQNKIINDSIFSVGYSKATLELKTIYDTEKKEQQIAKQETEIELLEERDKVSSLQKWLLGSGLGLSLLVFGFGFYGIRQKMKRNKLEREKVATQLAFKKKELTTQALHLAKKNETLENLKQKAKELKEKEASTNGYQQLITSINFDLQDDNNWENFARYFEEVHKDFNSNVAKKYPEVTPNELRLMALLKMNLSSKEIANILNISIPGIKKARQRLRKKMNLSTGDSLENAVLSI